MTALVTHLSVLLNLVALALPPGCCQLLMLEANAAQPVALNCCAQRSAADSTSHDRPSTPAAPCCCVRQAVVAEKAPSPKSELQPLAAAEWASQLTQQIEQAVEAAAATPLAAGPPLRILQCVWRC